MGASAAVTRVLVVAMVRDLFEAEAMARVMSLVFMVFMLMPVLAPNIGQLILLFAPGGRSSSSLAVYGSIMLIWSWLRLPETLHPEYRRSLQPGGRSSARRGELREPQSRGYTMAMTVSFGCLVAYIASIQQIVFDAFHEGRYIGLVFARLRRRWRLPPGPQFARRRAVRPAPGRASAPRWRCMVVTGPRRRRVWRQGDVAGSSSSSRR